MMGDETTRILKEILDIVLQKNLTVSQLMDVLIKAGKTRERVANDEKRTKTAILKILNRGNLYDAQFMRPTGNAQTSDTTQTSDSAIKPTGNDNAKTLNSTRLTGNAETSDSTLTSTSNTPDSAIKPTGSNNAKTLKSTPRLTLRSTSNTSDSAIKPTGSDKAKTLKSTPRLTGNAETSDSTLRSTSNDNASDSATGEMWTVYNNDIDITDIIRIYIGSTISLGYTLKLDKRIVIYGYNNVSTSNINDIDSIIKSIKTNIYPKMQPKMDIVYASSQKGYIKNSQSKDTIKLIRAVHLLDNANTTFSVIKENTKSVFMSIEDYTNFKNRSKEYICSEIIDFYVNSLLEDPPNKHICFYLRKKRRFITIAPKGPYV